ncbi:MAG: nucleoid-associated protein [Bacteroidales bacterium]|nr:nucleoid-associated protein [Bacteroidales bacterium]
MLLFNDTTIDEVVVHKVGNKTAGDGYALSQHCAQTDDNMKDVLAHYFLSHFKSEEYNNFFHDSGLQFNVVYGLISSIFDDPNEFYEKSVALAKHLYEQSNHPKIKGGEFYMVYFRNCQLDDTLVDAIGLFKSENKDTFLRVKESMSGFQLETESGINTNKLDKGCLIFNTEKEDGYVVAVVDTTNKGLDAQYWTNDFLHIHPRKDEYYNTENTLAVYKNFIVKELPFNEDIKVSRADQADLLNKSVQYFKEKETFDMNSFAEEVIQKPELIQSFNQYKENFETENNVELADNFNISAPALKKQSRRFKSVIKLDKNFHIYVHGNTDLMEQGADEKGKFYKVYYNEES